MILNLDQQFKPLAGQEISFEAFTFSGGEPHIKIKPFKAERVTVTHRVYSFNDLGLLLIAVDALRRMGAKEISLLLPYFPGARQDRVMVPGESLSVKVYADLINQLKLDSISIYDPHSDVTPALLNNCSVISNHDFVARVVSQLPDDFILVSPDAGASKKILKLGMHLGVEQILECGKIRDVATGQLSGFKVPAEDLGKKACLIADDICDGGGTFMGLAKELKAKNAGELYLAVSHGIFSKGTEALSEVFSKVFTTDSIQNIEDPAISQIKLQDLLK